MGANEIAMEEIKLPPPTNEQVKEYRNWWDTVSAPWRRAYNEVYLKQNSDGRLPDDTLHLIWESPALRFAGPTAMYPNMSFELEDLSGIAALKKASILVVVHHKLQSFEEIAHWRQLESLFLYNNQISDLQPAEKMTKLKEFYLQNNLVKSLKPLKKITDLHTLYCNYNQLESLEGIVEKHSDNMKQFVCLPNDNIRDRDVMKFEREMGIRCMKG